MLRNIDQQQIDSMVLLFWDILGGRWVGLFSIFCPIVCFLFFIFVLFSFGFLISAGREGGRKRETERS